MQTSYSQRLNKAETEEALIGTWVLKKNKNTNAYHYVKAKELEENLHGLIFSDDGNVIIYETFGCQLPIVTYRPFKASWEVKSSKVILIDRHYPGEDLHKMKVSKLSKNILEFVWDQ